MSNTGNNFDPVARTAQISTEIREAIRAALPAPPEQFFTVMVPGKVVNLEDYTGGFDSNGTPVTAVLPNRTELNQAMLCDDMPTLSSVQLGPTGKSVSRSFAAALTKLVPSGTTVGIDDGKALSETQVRYKKAMEWLTTLDDKNGQSRVELYTKKQFAYTQVVENKTKAFNEALKKATEDPTNRGDVKKISEAYDRWVNENARTYRNYVQAAYMDWVITGRKEEVEYYFSVVDQDSALARVEQCKEAMRNMVIQDTDGSVEYQKVRLTPSAWAVFAKNKAASGVDNTRTAEWYSWEISRLRKMNAMLEALKTTSSSSTAVAAAVAPDNHELQDAIKVYMIANDAYKRSETEETDEEKKKAALETYNKAKADMKKKMEESDAENVKSLSKLASDAQDKMLAVMAGEKGIAAQTIKENNSKITEYEADRLTLMQQRNNGTNGIAESFAIESGIPQPAPDPQAAKPKDQGMDFFTPITVEITASSSSDSSSSHSTSMSFGASGSYGLFSFGAEASHSNAASDAESSMAKNSCKISFECMRVDISRPWLRAELFYDSDLTTPLGEFISPGFGRLRDLMEQKTNQSKEDREVEMERYSTFPMYPTACNVVLEISGETSSIQSHFSTSSTSAKANVGYGPFKVSASVAHTETQASSKCEATATGCRITIKSPQIIGWISQMVPALPRLNPTQQAAALAKLESLKQAAASTSPAGGVTATGTTGESGTGKQTAMPNGTAP